MKTRVSQKPVSLLLLMLLCMQPEAARANAQSFPFGGRLTEAGGKPLKGPVDIGIRFFSVASGGSPLGTGLQTYPGVPLRQGVFQLEVSLSDADFKAIFAQFTTPVWVEIVDLSRNKIYPRQRLTAVPYAAKVPVDGQSISFNSSGQLEVGPHTPKANGQFISKDSSGFFWATPPAAGTSIQGVEINSTAPTAGQVLQFDGNKWSAATLNGGTVMSVTASAPLVLNDNASAPQLSLPAASASSSGYMKASDFAAFTAKQTALGFSPVNKAGDTLSGNLNMGNQKITGLAAPSLATDLANKTYVEQTSSEYLKADASIPLSGDWFAGPFDLNAAKIISASGIKTQGQNAIRLDPYGAGAGQVGEFRFYELNASEQNYVGFRAPDSIPANVIWTLPASAGTAGHVLQTNGAGQLVWVNLSAAANSIESVAGKSGAVTLNADDVAEGPSLKYSTAARVRAAAVSDSVVDTIADHAPSQNAVFDQLALKVGKSGSTMTGPMNMGNQNVVNAAAVTTGTLTSTESGISLDPFGAAAGNTAKIQFKELSANGTDSVGFKAPDSIANSTIWTLPSDDGASSEFLSSDGSANLSWLAPSATNVADALNDGVTTVAPSQNAVFDALSARVPLAGATMTGAIAMSAQAITNLGTPTVGGDAATKAYVDSVVAPYAKKDGSTALTGNWAVGGFDITGVGSFSAGAASFTSLQTNAQNAFTAQAFGSSAGETAEIRFKALAGNKHIGFKAPDSVASNVIWTLPSADGGNGQILKTNGSKTLGFVDPSTLTVVDALNDGVTSTAPSQNAVFDALTPKLNKTGGSMTGALDLGNNALTNLAAPSANDDASTKAYADTTAAVLVRRDGTAPLTGNWSAANFNITGVGTFTAGASTLSSIQTSAQDAVTLGNYGAAAGNSGELQFKELSVVRGNSINFKAPDAIAANRIWTLPSADGTAGQVLKTNGAGQLSWVSLSSLTVADAIADGVTGFAPSENAVFDALALKVDLAGDSLSGNLNMGSQKITNLATPTLAGDAVNKSYADTVFAPYLRLDGTAPLTGNWAVGGFAISGVSSFAATAGTVSSLTTSGQAAVTIDPFGSAAGNSGELRFKELSTVRGNYVGFKAPDALAANRIWTLPSADGAANQLLLTDGAGNLSWGSPTSTSIVADSLSDGVNAIAPSQNATFDALAAKLNLSGGTMTGAIDMSSQKITNLATPSVASELATMAYADGVIAPLLKRDGSVPLTANWNAGGFAVSGVGNLSAGASSASTMSSSGQAALTINPYAAPAGSTSELRFSELTGGNYVGFKAPDVVSANKIWTLPAADGAADTLLITNGSGVLSFASASSLTLTDAIVDGVLATAPSQNAVFDGLTARLNKSGGTMTGALNMGSQPINNLAAPSAGSDAATMGSTDTAVAAYVAKAGGTALTADWAVGNFNITGLNTFTGSGALTSGSITTSAQNAFNIRAYGASAGNGSELRFQELAANGSHYVGFKAPDTIAADKIFTLPNAWGSANDVLTTNGSGTLSWADMRSVTVVDAINDAVTATAPSQNAVFDALTGKLNLNGGTMSGAINMGAFAITNLATPTVSGDAANKAYADSAVTPYLRRDGSVPLTGNWAVGGQNISGVGTFAAGASTLTSVTTSAQAGAVIAPYAAPAGSTSELRFKALTGSNYIALKAPDSISNELVWTLPAVDSTANHALKTNGSGILSWVDTNSLVVADALTGGVTALAPSQNAVFDALTDKLDRAGGTMTAALAMGTNQITGLATPTVGTDMASKGYVDSPLSGLIKLDGTVPLTSAWALGSFNVSGVGTLSAGATSVTSLTNSGALSATTLSSSAQAGLLVGAYGAGTGTGEIRMLERAANGSEYVGFKAPNTISANRIWTLPSTDGAADSVLKTDGAGTLSWVTPQSLLIEDAVVAGHTTLAPTENAVYDALSPLVLRAGHTMSGTLNLPANGLQVDTTNYQLSTSGGNVGIKSSILAAPLSIANGVLGEKIAFFGSSGAGNWGIGVQNNLLQFYIPANQYGFNFGYGSSASMTTTARLETKGFLGIGTGATTAVNAPLEVKMTGATQGTEQSMLNLDSDNGDVGGGPNMIFKNASGGWLASINSIDNDAGDGILIFRTSNDSAQTSTLTSATNKMLIYGSGDVGIKNKTTGAIAPLEVVKSAANAAESQLVVLDSNNSSNGSGASLSFNNAASGYMASIAAVAVGTDARLDFRTSEDAASTGSALTNSDTKMSIAETGYVGILAAAGTSTSYPLSFGSATYGGANAPRMSLWGNDGNGYYGFGIQHLTLQMVTVQNAVIDFGYGQSSSMTNSVRFFNTGAGYLAIGTVANGLGTADSMVHIRGGGLRVEDPGNSASGMSFGSCSFGACGATTYETIQLHTNHNFRINFGTTERFQFTSGGAALKGGTLAWETISDIRSKDVHGTFNLGLDEVLQLDTIVYNYKKDNRFGYNSEEEYVGFSAQDVQKVIPAAVKKDADGYLSLNADPIMWTMLNGIKDEHKSRVSKHEEQRTALAAKRAEIDQLKMQLRARAQRLEKAESTVDNMLKAVCAKDPAACQE